MQGVGPYHGLDAAAEGIEQDDDDHAGSGEPDGDAHRVEDEGLQHKNDEVHAQGGAEQARQDEEEGAGFVGGTSHAVLEDLVYRGDILFIVYGQQHVGDGDVAEDVAEHDAEVGEVDVGHVARHRHEGDARQRCADHAVGHYEPRRFAVAGEVAGVVGLAGGEPHDDKQQDGVGCEEKENQVSHAKLVINTLQRYVFFLNFDVICPKFYAQFNVINME